MATVTDKSLATANGDIDSTDGSVLHDITRKLWRKGVSALQTDQAAAFVPNKPYAVGDTFSWPEQDPADENTGRWFNWNVNTAIAVGEFAAFDATNFATVKAKVDRFGITGASTAPLDRGPTTMVGNLWRWNRTDALPDTLLPCDGAEHDVTHADYDALWSIRANVPAIASSREDAGSRFITIRNYNGQGRFFRAGPVAGIEQNDATAVNGLHDNGHSHSISMQHNEASGTLSVTNGGGGFIGSTNTNTGTAQLDSTDTETRPINVSEIVCLIAKAWLVSGDVTINSGDAELPTSLGGGSWGGGHANTFTSNGIWTGNNTAALAGAPLANWAFQLDVMRVGDWIVQRYNADNSWIIYRRESYDGGGSWTSWLGV